MLIDAGFSPIWTDGSAENSKQGPIAGYGVHALAWEARDFVPIFEQQTNNRAELYAVLRAILLAEGRVVIVMDSQYVYKGLTGRMHQWHEAHWVLRTGAVAHVDLWQAILQALQQSQATIKWHWVPSHAGIEGNERADFLADIGIELSPLFRITDNSRVATPRAPIGATATPPRPSGGGLRGSATFPPMVLDTTTPLSYLHATSPCHALCEVDDTCRMLIFSYEEMDPAAGSGDDHSSTSDTESNRYEASHELEGMHDPFAFLDHYIQEQSPFKKKPKYDFTELEDPEDASSASQSVPPPPPAGHTGGGVVGDNGHLTALRTPGGKC